MAVKRFVEKRIHALTLDVGSPLQFGVEIRLEPSRECPRFGHAFASFIMISL